MLGLKRGIVKLIPYQKQWHNEFIKEKTFLLKLLKIKIDIVHIGSTAVPELLAKPIIDIIIGLTPNIQTEQIYKILSENRYEDRGEEGISERRLFVKGSEHERTHHLHIIDKDSDRWHNYLLFRDYLRQHKSACKEYNLLKQKLAKKYPTNREEYTNGKADFINKILNYVENRQGQ